MARSNFLQSPKTYNVSMGGLLVGFIGGTSGITKLRITEGFAGGFAI